MPLVEQELLTLPEHLSSPPVIVTWSLVSYVCFVDCFLSFWPLCCLSFDLWIVIAPLVSSISSWKEHYRNDIVYKFVARDCIINDLNNYLQINCQQALFKALPVIIKSVAPSVVKTFLEKGGTEMLTSAGLDAKQEVLQGLHKSLQVPDPPDSITSVLYQCLEILYRIHIQEVYM